VEFTIDIDTGGTFTDGFVRGNGRTELGKVDTTPHDFTVCFMECIEEAARRFGFPSASQLLAQTKTLRLSTTIGTNVLIQASGPKLGLLATRGGGENAYAPGNAANPAVDFILPKDMIVPIDEEISESGTSVRLPSSSDVLSGVKDLLDRGARRIVVSFARAPLNPAHERECQEIILGDYPAHYLGSVPLLLSTEVSSQLDDQCRTDAALIDAYIHQEMAHYLYKADEDVRKRRYRWPLLIVHANGGACRVAKTKAIDTLDSGPAAGLFGAAFLARLYGIENVLTLDVGGTSSDIGFVARGEPCFTAYKTIGGVPIKERAIETTSIGGGGSSVARLDDQSLKVGPESAGAIPGPACYGLGGDNATVTDAWVVLGYIDPEYFLGGRKKLDAAQARAAIERHVAEPLKMAVEQAAEAVVKEMSSRTAQSVRKFMSARELGSQDITMFAFGGAGGLTCSSVAKAAGLSRVYLFPFGAHFCAFGSSCADVVHTYSVATSLELESNSAGAIKAFNQAVLEMKDDAYFDMQGEGFEKDKISLMLEMVVTSHRSPHPTVIQWPPISLKGEADIRGLLDLYQREAKLDAPQDKLFLRELRLKASCHIADPQFPKYTRAGESPREALKGRRPVYWNGEFRDALLYDQSLLTCGNVVRGLAIIESTHTTALVPPGTRYIVDEFLNGVIEEE